MRTVRIILIMIMVMCGASMAFAQPVVFTPNPAALTVPAGGLGQVEVTVSSAEPGTYFVVYAQQIQGQVPPEWVEVSPAAGFGLPAQPLFKVHVPPGTPPDTYTSTVYSFVSDPHSMGGTLVQTMTLEVTVPEPVPLCGEGPRFELSVAGESAIWAEMKSTQDVIITGRVVLAEGCELDGPVSWTVQDEYGSHEPNGKVLAEDDLSFEVSVPVEVFRRGSDRNGRLYQVFFQATTANGLTGESQPPVSIMISHDSGGKK